MSEFSLTEINERIARESTFVDDLKKALGLVIVGQDDLINRILIGLLANGHILLECRKMQICRVLHILFSNGDANLLPQVLT